MYAALYWVEIRLTFSYHLDTAPKICAHVAFSMGEHNGASCANTPVAGPGSFNQTPANNLYIARSHSSSLIPASSLSKTTYPALAPGPSSSKASNGTKTMESPHFLPSLGNQSSLKTSLSNYKLQKWQNIKCNKDILTALIGQPLPILPSVKNVAKKRRKIQGVVPESACRCSCSVRKNFFLWVFKLLLTYGVLIKHKDHLFLKGMNMKVRVEAGTRTEKARAPAMRTAMMMVKVTARTRKVQTSMVQGMSTMILT